MIVGNDDLTVQYPRWIELLGVGKASKSANFYNRCELTLNTLYTDTAVKNLFENYERVFACFDNESWECFKNKVVKKSQEEPHPDYGYTHITNCLNEAYGYEYLKTKGYSNIKFVEEGNRKSPDLIAEKDGKKCCLEVKTIQASLDETKKSNLIAEKGKAGILKPEDFKLFNGDVVLTCGFNNKLQNTFKVAREQVIAVKDAKRRIIYFVINLDRQILSCTSEDHKIVDDIRLILCSFVKLNNNPPLEIICYYPGAFSYFAQEYNDQKQ